MAPHRATSSRHRAAPCGPVPARARTLRAAGCLLVSLLLLTTAGCFSTRGNELEKATARVRLIGPIWTCVQLRGQPVAVDPKPTVLFGADGRVSGNGTVNRFFGKFTRPSASTLAFSEVSSTRRGGTPEQMEVEAAFLEGLEQTTGFKVTGQGIQLLVGEEVLMELSGVADPGSWIPSPPNLEGPPGSMAGGVEWLKLTSGEWLKGEFKVLNRGSVEFESDELDTLNIDWDDVAELYTTRQFTLLLEDRETVIGALRVNGDRIVLLSGGGQEVLSRSDVQRMVPGEPREINYWSGNVDISATVREGNTDQVDVTSRLGALRRTAQSRLDLNIEAIYGTQNRQKVTNNQRFNGKFDSYISSRLFWTILGVEVYADEFQNIESRTAPYTGIGYTVFDRATLESNVSVGIGYRRTTYSSVEVGESGSETTPFLQLSADLDADLTEKIEFIASYSAQIGLEDIANTNQNASAELQFDFLSDFKVFVRTTLSRVGQPAADENGQIPLKNDFRHDFGWRWSW